MTPAAREFRAYVAFATARGVSASDALALEAEHGTARARALIERHAHKLDPGPAALLTGRAAGVYEQRERAMLEAAAQRPEREEPPRPAPTPPPAPTAQTFRGFDDPTSIAGVYARREAVMLAAARQRQPEHGESTPAPEPPTTPSVPPRTLTGINTASVYDRREQTMIDAARKRARTHTEE